MSDATFIFGNGQTDREAMVERDKHLKQVLQKLQENGLTANLPKWEFRKPKMELYGIVFSKDGIEPDPKKVDALIMMTSPKSGGEVQSILGMPNFLARFIRHYSTIKAHIRKLTQKKQTFEWMLEQNSAFDRPKDILGSAQVVT